LNNIFIEGIPGSGKSTLLNQLQERLPEYKTYREGDLSPVELAWCSYMTMEQYQEVCNSFIGIQSELKAHTVTEGNKKITAYTRILTDIQGFHRFMEQYEIYNGRVSFPEFKEIVLQRYSSFQEKGNIFECSFFQNSIECMMLFYQLSDREIRDFYREAYDRLKNKGFRLLYLDVEDIEAAIVTIKDERVDTNGNELWYPFMLQYLNESPYGKKHNIKDFEGVIYHFNKRIDTERSIISETIGKNALIVPSKDYKIDEIVSWCVDCKRLTVL
jgi:hypothetical protein